MNLTAKSHKKEPQKSKSEGKWYLKLRKNNPDSNEGEEVLKVFGSLGLWWGVTEAGNVHLLATRGVEDEESVPLRRKLVGTRRSETRSSGNRVYPREAFHGVGFGERCPGRMDEGLAGTLVTSEKKNLTSARCDVYGLKNIKFGVRLWDDHNCVYTLSPFLSLSLFLPVYTSSWSVFVCFTNCKEVLLQ